MKKVAQRYLAIWKPSFLADFIREGKNDRRTTLKLWFGSVALVAVLIAGFVGIGAAIKLPQFQAVIAQHVPEDAWIETQGDMFVTHNIPEPLISTFQNKEGKDVAIIVDTKANTHSTEDFRAYDAGILFARSAIYLKTNTEEDITVVSAASLAQSQDIGISREFFLGIHLGHVALFALIIFIFIFIVLGIGRLFLALFWALVLYIIALSFGLKEKYFTYYQLVLNWYCVQLTIAVVLFLLMQTTGGFFREVFVFIAIFLINLSYWNKQKFASIVQEKNPKNIPKRPKVVHKEKKERAQRTS